MSDARLFPTAAVPEAPSWFQRVVRGISDPAGAAAAIKQLLRRADGVRVDVTSIQQIFLQYGVDSLHTQARIREAVYHDAVAHTAGENSAPTARAFSVLASLAETLALTPESIQRTLAEAARETLRRTVRRVLEDKVLSNEERENINELARSLDIPDDQRDEILRDEISPILASAVDDAAADRRYSPEEERALQALAKDLGVDLAFGAATAAALERMRTMWQIENGQLPEVFSPITLNRGEVCHYSVKCSWREIRTRTVRVDYAGVSGSVRIMKGVRVRLGTVVPRRVTETEIVESSSGTLYVTSKRVVLQGGAGNKSVTWKSVFGQEVFADAIKLEKSSGKDPYLFIAKDEIEYASVVIAAAMAAGN